MTEQNVSGRKKKKETEMIGVGKRKGKRNKISNKRKKE